MEARQRVRRVRVAEVLGTPPAGMPSPTPPQALKVLISSSTLSASACTPAWVGGLETAPIRCSLKAQPSTTLLNWPRISAEDNGELSTGKPGSRIGVDLSNLWFVFRRPCSTPMLPCRRGEILESVDSLQCPTEIFQIAEYPLNVIPAISIG